jgi:drug/metabolite transporter (DMT)-like permease
MSQKLDIKLVFALFSIALFWGTTYLAMRIGVETIPPILVTGLRNLIAGGILFIYLKSNKQLESMTLSRIKQNIK